MRNRDADQTDHSHSEGETLSQRQTCKCHALCPLRRVGVGAPVCVLHVHVCVHARVKQEDTREISRMRQIEQDREEMCSRDENTQRFRDLAASLLWQGLPFLSVSV